MQPELHTLFAQARLRHDHDTLATDAEGASSLAADSVALRASQTEDGAAAAGELEAELERAA